jgi:hypothetical protein
MLFPMLTVDWLHLELCFFKEYCNSSQNIIILFWKYLVDFRSEEAWLNHFWENIMGKLFAVKDKKIVGINMKMPRNQYCITTSV